MLFMVVDDSSTMRKIVGVALKSIGHDFIEAENGQDALGKLENNKIDFFIVDLNMPVMNGIEFIKNLRGRTEYYKIPAVMLTTESGDDVMAQGKAAGATAWMVKPFEKEDLVALIDQILK